MTDHYDVIVIGSGAGGGTVTHALAPTGARILLLERGGWLPREPENWSPAAVWADGRYRNSGEWTDLDTGERFTPKQHYYVGGNTKFYGAALFRLRPQDFGEIRHHGGVSPAWPISSSRNSGELRESTNHSAAPPATRPAGALKPSGIQR